MRHKQVFDYDGLREAVVFAVETSGKKRKEIAGALGVHKGSFSRALNYSGSRYAKLQISILEYLNPNYTIIESTNFQVFRKDKI